MVLRTPAELESVVKADPFPSANPSKLHVGFMAEKPTAAAVAKLDNERFRPDEFAIIGAELYLHLQNGMTRTKLPAYLDRQLKIPTTVRNWNTVNKLIEQLGLVRGGQSASVRFWGWTVSPLASMATNCSIRRSRVSARLAVSIRYRTA